MPRKKKIKTIDLIQLFNECTPIIDLITGEEIQKVSLAEGFLYDVKEWRVYTPKIYRSDSKETLKETCNPVDVNRNENESNSDTNMSINISDIAI